jgi:peptide chain release factor 3
MDREARDPIELLDEIASTLQLETVPMTWPVGQGQNFRGCYDLRGDRMLLIGESERGERAPAITCSGTDDPALARALPPDLLEKLQEEADLVRGAYPEPDLKSYREGHLTPVFFGSALRNFGVQELLDGLAAMAPPPRSQPGEPRDVAPDENKVSGFVFKVQANMDPNHRDRVAFMRLCSGHFKRGMKLFQVRTGKTMAVHNPILFFAQDRGLVEEARPGDIIGVPNHGTMRVGDTMTEGEVLRFTGIPNFAPEVLRRVRLDDPMKGKQLQRALNDLAEEGVTQVFRPALGGNPIVGVVGQLQLDVLATRIETEYSVKAGFEGAPYETARWISADDPAEVTKFVESNRGACAVDRDDAPVFLARNAWELNYTIERNPKIRFTATRERS